MNNICSQDWVIICFDLSHFSPFWCYFSFSYNEFLLYQYISQVTQKSINKKWFFVFELILAACHARCVVGTSEWISPFWFIRHHHHQMHLPITFAGNQNEMTHIGVDKHKSIPWHKQCHKIHLWFLIQIIWKPRPGWHHMTRCVSPEVGWRNPRHFPDFPAIRWRLKNEEHSNHDH